MEKLTQQHLGKYLGTGLRGKYKLSEVIKLSANQKDEIRECELTSNDNVSFFVQYCKPILHPLSSLTEPIWHEGKEIVPIEWFEIGDDRNDSIEYDHGNIKLINHIFEISDHNMSYDIKFLPYAVVQKLIEWHFAIDIPDGTWIPVDEVNSEIYK